MSSVLQFCDGEITIPYDNLNDLFADLIKFSKYNFADNESVTITVQDKALSVFYTEVHEVDEEKYETILSTHSFREKLGLTLATIIGEYRVNKLPENSILTCEEWVNDFQELDNKESLQNKFVIVERLSNPKDFNEIKEAIILNVLKNAKKSEAPNYKRCGEDLKKDFLTKHFCIRSKNGIVTFSDIERAAMYDKENALLKISGGKITNENLDEKELANFKKGFNTPFHSKDYALD